MGDVSPKSLISVVPFDFTFGGPNLFCSRLPTMNIQIVLFDGFDELDVFAPFEVLHMAALLVPDMQVKLVSPGPVEQVTSNRSIQVQTQGMLGQLAPDLVVVPGGGWIDDAPQGARAEHRRGVLPAALAKLHADGVIMASVCTGAML